MLIIYNLYASHYCTVVWGKNTQLIFLNPKTQAATPRFLLASPLPPHLEVSIFPHCPYNDHNFTLHTYSRSYSKNAIFWMSLELCADQRQNMAYCRSTYQSYRLSLEPGPSCLPALSRSSELRRRLKDVISN